jgi:hypothetical protein
MCCCTGKTPGIRGLRLGPEFATFNSDSVQNKQSGVIPGIHVNGARVMKLKRRATTAVHTGVDLPQFAARHAD